MPARTDQGVDLIDEEDDRLHRLARLFQQGLEAGLELPAHACAGQQGSDIEAPQAAVLQIGRNLALRDGQREPLDHRCLADARVSREQGIVLTATQQDVDHRADLVSAPDDRIDLPLRRALGQIRAVAPQRGPSIRRCIRERGAGFTGQR
ncbi:hypothetical protein D3C72_1905090 [compost metagenome]